MIALLGATVAQARRALAERFRAAGIESPELDARILIGHALGLDHAGLAAAENQTLAEATALQIDAAATRTLRPSGSTISRRGCGAVSASATVAATNSGVLGRAAKPSCAAADDSKPRSLKMRFQE